MPHRLGTVTLLIHLAGGLFADARVARCQHNRTTYARERAPVPGQESKRDGANHSAVHDHLLRRLLLGLPEAPPLPQEKPKPFMLVFTSSVGSSWLMQELSVNPSVCVIGHEPLDDYCTVGSSRSVNGKRQVGWLRVALNPPSLSVYSEHHGGVLKRGEAWRRAWRLWKAKLIQHALPCRVEEIHKSLEGERCDASYVRAFGFKTRLFAGGMLSDRQGSKWDRVREELQDAGVRVIRLKRRNRLEQALSVYWKKRPIELGKNGKLVRGPARRPHDAPRAVEHVDQLDEILATISQREKLLDAAVEYMRVPTLTMTYEDLTGDHVAAVRRLGGFLGVGLSESALDAIPEAERWFKHSPKGLCNAVADYKSFCSHYSKTTCVTNSSLRGQCALREQGWVGPSAAPPLDSLTALPLCVPLTCPPLRSPPLGTRSTLRIRASRASGAAANAGPRLPRCSSPIPCAVTSTPSPAPPRTPRPSCAQLLGKGTHEGFKRGHARGHCGRGFKLEFSRKSPSSLPDLPGLLVLLDSVLRAEFRASRFSFPVRSYFASRCSCSWACHGPPSAILTSSARRQQTNLPKASSFRGGAATFSRFVRKKQKFAQSAKLESFFSPP